MKVFACRRLPLFLTLVAVVALLWPAAASAQKKNSAPNKDLKPTFGSVKLTAGFIPDPFKKELLAGGPIQTKLGGVAAWVAESPDFILDYTAGRWPLTFYADANSDTTLLICLPDGKWIADDDSGGNLNPLIQFDKPQSGRYAIWVGTVAKLPARATLFITELPSIKPETVPAEKDILYEVSSRQLDNILKDLKIPHEENAKGLLLWKFGNYTVAMERFNEGKSVVISMNLMDYTDVNLEQINKWNDEKSLSRAILRTKEMGKYPRLESDLNCELGVTPKSVDVLIKRFEQSVDEFKTFLKPGGKGGKQAPLKKKQGRAFPEAALKLIGLQDRTREVTQTAASPGIRIV